MHEEMYLKMLSLVLESPQEAKLDRQYTQN